MPDSKSPRRRIDPEQGRAALRMWTSGQREAELHPGGLVVAEDATSGTDGAAVATAVRFSLEELASRAPGGALEVRVPPFGATQCIEGPSHRRGTPPAVVEMSPDTWLGLVTGRVSWADAVAAGDVDASGARSDLSEYLPIASI